MVQVAAHDVRVRYGFRVSSPARSWCELGSELDVADLVAAGDFLIHWRHPLASRDELALAVTTHPSSRGRRALREALLHLDERSESRKESLLRVTVVRGGIVGVVTNLKIQTSGGFGYRADLAVPSRKVIIEYQSDYHGDMAQFRRDMTRRARLEADGWMVVLVNADDLRDAAELVTRIRRAIAARHLVAGH